MSDFFVDRLESEFFFKRSETEFLVIVRGEKGDPGSSGSSVFIPVIVDDQTLFTLAIAPPAPSRTRLIVNGVEYHFGDSYNLNNYQVTWLNQPFRLKSNFQVKLYY